MFLYMGMRDPWSKVNKKLTGNLIFPFWKILGILQSVKSGKYETTGYLPFGGGSKKLEF